MTEPNLAEGCAKDKEDSDFYVYSIPGFDPCNFYDFTQEAEFRFMLKCVAVDEKGKVIRAGHPEGVGYEYSNVISPADPGLEIGKSLFEYAAVNTATGYRVTEGSSAHVTVDFRDWKYLSQIERFISPNITDPQVLAGQKEGSMTIDFNKMTKRDA